MRTDRAIDQALALVTDDYQPALDGPETIRAQAVAQVARHLDAAEIRASKVFVTADDSVELRFAFGADFLTAVSAFGLGYVDSLLRDRSAAGTWHGIRIWAHVGLEALDTRDVDIVASMGRHPSGRAKGRAHA